MRRIAMSFLLCVASTAAMAQPVYRCGNVYADTACPAGKVIDASDARTDAQRAEASRLASKDKHLSREMEQERLAAQAEQARLAKPAKTKPAKRVRATPIRWARL